MNQLPEYNDITRRGATDALQRVQSFGRSDNASYENNLSNQISLRSDNSVNTEFTINNESIHSLYENQNSDIRGSTPSFDILPSYQMHQSILNRPLSLNGEDTTGEDVPLPEYSLSPSSFPSTSSSPSSITNSDGPSYTNSQEESVLSNINSIPVMPFSKDIKISIKMQNLEKSFVTNGDCLSGIITLENTSNIDIPFEMFLVTFEGELKISSGTYVEEKLYKYKNFLRMVDLGASWTDADATRSIPKSNTLSGLPSDRILTAKTTYQKLFTFRIPSAALEQVCNTHIVDHSILPPTFGSAELSVSLKNTEDKLFEKFSYTDFTVPGYSVNYSVNARLITISKSEDAKMIVKALKKNSVRFIPKSAQKFDNSYDYQKHKPSPSYQLNLLFKQIEHNINELKTTIDAIDQDRRILVYWRRRPGNCNGDDDEEETIEHNILDDSKRRNLYIENPSNNLLFTHSVIEELFVKRYKKDYRFFRKKKKTKTMFSSISSPTPSKSLTISSLSSNKHDSRISNPMDFDLGVLNISSSLNDNLIVNFNKLSSPFNKNGDHKISIPLTLDFNYIMPSITSQSDKSEFAKFFPKEPDVDLMYINVTSKGSTIPIDLDFEWFTSKEKFRKNIKEKFLKLAKDLKSLPQGTLVAASTIQSLNAMNHLQFESGVLSKSITVDAVKNSTIEYDEEKCSLNSKMHLKLAFNSTKLKSAVIVPDFQTCLVGRMYFLRLKFKANSSNIANCDIDYDSETENVIKNLDGNYKFYLDVPISVKKAD